MPALPDFDGWWRTERQLWWRDFDSLGHLTAGAYPLVYHDAFADFMTQAWQTDDASYVAARLDVVYLREIRPHESPVQVYVELRRLGRAGFDAALAIVSASGIVCSTADASFAAWDRTGRGSRAMTDVEQAALRALGDPFGRLPVPPR